GPALPRHLCQPEEDLPEAGPAFLGLFARPGSRAGPDSALGPPDPPASAGGGRRPEPPSRARLTEDRRARLQYEHTHPRRRQVVCAPRRTPAGLRVFEKLPCVRP